MVSCAGAAATAMLLYACAGMFVAVCATGVLLAHEAGHYVVAWVLGAKPKLPVLVPLGIGALGVTVVYDLATGHKPLIAIAGPLVGWLVAAGAVLATVGLGASGACLVAASLLALETYALTLGSDGRAWRARERTPDGTPRWPVRPVPGGGTSPAPA